MHKHVLTTIMRGDEPPALCNIEPLAAAFSLPQFGLRYCNGWPMGSCKYTQLSKWQPMDKSDNI
jgi:hypothetical protein